MPRRPRSTCASLVENRRLSPRDTGSSSLALRFEIAGTVLRRPQAIPPPPRHTNGDPALVGEREPVKSPDDGARQWARGTLADEASGVNPKLRLNLVPGHDVQSHPVTSDAFGVSRGDDR